MNRREMFKALGGLATGGAVSVAPAKKYGCLTIAGHRHHLAATGEHLRVYVDGVEAHDVYEADDVEGYALIFCRDAEHHRANVKAGRLHIRGEGDHAACRLRLTGQVVIAPGPPP